jgi:hypothetical protein
MVTLTEEAIPFLEDEVAAAAYVAKRYQAGERRGISALAEAMGKSFHVLANKLNPNQDAHHLSVFEMRAIETLADPDGVIVRTHCRARGFVAIPMVPRSAGADDEILDELLKVHEVFGSMAQELKSARADGCIEPAEYEKVRAMGHALHQQIEQFLASLAMAVREPVQPNLRSVA